MVTRFERCQTGKVTSKFVFILMLTLIGCAAYKTNAAVCFLLHRTHLYGIIYAIFGITLFLVMTGAKRHSGKYKKTLCFASCFLIYYLLLIFVWSACSTVMHFSNFVKAVGVLLAFGLSGITVLYGYLHAKTIKHPTYEVHLKETSRRYRVALVSDIHLGLFIGAKHIKRMVSVINSLHPDIVVIAGDIFDVDNYILDCKEDLKDISDILCKIESSEGVFAVLGNHDPNIETDNLLEFFKSSNIRLLHNSVEELQKINLVGRSDEANNIRVPLSNLMTYCNPSKPTIVLDHNPQGITEAAENNAELILCGHTHRGQFFPLTAWTKLTYKNHYFYGYKLFNKTHSIISSGIGFFPLPIRIGTNSEVVNVEIGI